MSAERDKAILIGGAIFVAGFVTGVSSLIYLLNRKVSGDDKPLAAASDTKNNVTDFKVVT